MPIMKPKKDNPKILESKPIRAEVGIPTSGFSNKNDKEKLFMSDGITKAVEEIASKIPNNSALEKAMNPDNKDSDRHIFTEQFVFMEVARVEVKGSEILQAPTTMPSEETIRKSTYRVVLDEIAAPAYEFDYYVPMNAAAVEKQIELPMSHRFMEYIGNAIISDSAGLRISENKKCAYCANFVANDCLKTMDGRDMFWCSGQCLHHHYEENSEMVDPEVFRGSKHLGKLWQVVDDLFIPCGKNHFWMPLF